MNMEEKIIEDIVADEKGYTQAFTDGFDMAESIAMNCKQKWYKSWAVWSSIIGLLVLVFSIFGVWDKIGITADNFKEIVSAIASVLVAFGVINSPNTKGSLG